MRKVAVIFFLVMCSVSLSAQDVVSSFIEKFGADDKLEVITIGKKMIDLMETMSGGDKEFSGLLEGLESIRVVSSKGIENKSDYYETAYSLLKNKKQGFEEVLSIKDPDENLLIVAKGSKGGVVKELVLISERGNNSFNMISLNGKIDMDALIKYSKNLNLSGFEKLETANNKTK